ncbi:hypothetical protein [Arenimonas aestuarii]
MQRWQLWGRLAECRIAKRIGGIFEASAKKDGSGYLDNLALAYIARSEDTKPFGSACIPEVADWCFEFSGGVVHLAVAITQADYAIKHGGRPYGFS